MASSIAESMGRIRRLAITWSILLGRSARAAFADAGNRWRPVLRWWPGSKRTHPRIISHRQGITAKRICELAQQGDAGRLQAVEHEAYYLGLGLANLINLFTPDAIVLSGSVMKSAALFLDRIRAVIRAGCRFVPAEKTELTLASLGTTPT